MALRIKLPALKPPLLPSPSSAVMEWGERKRKRSKRYLSSDDEFVAETDSVSVADYPQRQDSNSDIDVVGEEEHEQDDQRFNHTTNEPTKSKAMADSKHTAKGPKAKRKASATPPPLPTPAPPKKQKLPTIKKVKLANNNTSTSSSTVVVDTAAVLPVLPLGGKPTQDGVRKTMIGATDIDLSNKSIYEEIFSKTGQGDGGTPRAGGNRRTKEEERRKELNRQRDEAKAKRALEARQTFDLQAQFDRISRFEEKLKAVHSSAVFPNFLAAKWRQEWEKEKRRQKGKDWHDSNYSQGHGFTTREEGEVR